MNACYSFPPFSLTNSFSGLNNGIYLVYWTLFQIKDDPKNGLYVENLTEEYVSSYEDVTQILIKVGRTPFVGSSFLHNALGAC